MTPAEILKAAWVLIEDPMNWTTEYYSRDAKGEPVAMRSVNAVAFCAIGACVSVGGGALRFLDAAADELYGRSIATVNDDPDHGHEGVRCCYVRAIQLAEAEA